MYYFYDDISNTEFKREGIAKYFFSFIGPVGHNIWWEIRRNDSFVPKNGLKMPK